MTRKNAFLYNEQLSRHVLRDDHPLKATRLRHTYELLEAYDAFGTESSNVVEPRLATEQEIQSVHDPEYVSAVRSLSSGETKYNPARFNFGASGDNPIYEGIYEASALSTGASVVAAELIGDGQKDVAFNVSGGLHHAARDHASGFCVFNDPAIAIQYLVGMGLKVAYVDIDAHHGDGVQSAFYDTDQVLTISIHESGKFLFPGTGFVDELGTGPGKGHSVNIPLYPYTDDAIYLWAFRELVPPLINAFKPDVLVTQLGIDSHFDDPLSHLSISSRAFSEAVKEFSRMGLPWLALGGGGYDLSAVARCWTLAYGIMIEIDWLDDIPETYKDRYGLKHLRDSPTSPGDPKVREGARSFAEDTVEQVKRLIFLIHNLS